MGPVWADMGRMTASEPIHLLVYTQEVHLLPKRIFMPSTAFAGYRLAGISVGVKSCCVQTGKCDARYQGISERAEA